MSFRSKFGTMAFSSSQYEWDRLRIMPSSLDRSGLFGEFLIVEKMKASDEDSRTVKRDSARLEYHAAGPSQCSVSCGIQEKQPMTAADRRVAFGHVSNCLARANRCGKRDE